MYAACVRNVLVVVMYVCVTPCMYICNVCSHVRMCIMLCMYVMRCVNVMFCMRGMLCICVYIVRACVYVMYVTHVGVNGR